MKIVYCLNSIRHLGGIEMITIIKANALADVIGNEVYLAVTDNHSGAEIASVSSKVRVVDLDINYYEDDWKSKWYVLKGIFVKRRIHKERLKKVLDEIHPDVVVSVGLSEKYMLPSICGRDVDCVSIREVHSIKNYRRLHALSFFDKVSAWWADMYDYNYQIKKYDQVVVLTHEDYELNWNCNPRISVIPNPVTFRNDVSSYLNSKKIISIGRLTLPKNFSSLIRVFRYVVNKHPDWFLEIYGEGPQRRELQGLIENSNLTNNVYLKGYTSQVKEKMLEASLFVMSSKFEGFGLVLIEAMQRGLPCVSYACPCGPKDIITDGKDGFLVPLNDEKTMAEKICFLIEHPDVRAEMGKAALLKAEKYSIDKIVPMWMDLFNRLLEEKRKRLGYGSNAKHTSGIGGCLI